MPDEGFEHPRLIALYDTLEGDRLTLPHTLVLLAHGYGVEEVRDAPDRPGREFVFLARRPR